MPAPFQHSGLSTIMGSWPVIPSYVLGSAAFDPRVIESRAVILGVRRETSAGFNVAGKTMYLWIDGQLVSFRKTINFDSYPDPYTLDQVITEINTDALTTVAYNDNGFLRLESPSSGQDGYLKLGTFNDPDVFHELGLFSGTEVYGGQLKQAKHIDPDRQVALPGQFAISDGESFTADVINRAVHQLAVNSDRAEGLLGRKRVAKQKTEAWGSYTPTGVPDEEGVGISGGTQVYTGDSQTQAALDRIFVVLNDDGQEYTKRVNIVLTSDTTTFSNADGRQIATDTGGNFSASDEKDEIYVVSSDGSLPAALQDVPMKILEVQSPTVAVIQPIDPVTGDVVLFTTGGVSADRVDRSIRRVRVDQVRTSQSGTRVEGVQEQKSPPAGTHTPTRIDLNNRLVVPGATFFSDGVQVGDLVTWSSHSAPVPYDNNGEYRVGAVIDEETIELVADDWGPAFLNPDLTTPGDVIVSTDGLFYEDAWLRFLPEASGGAIPDSGDPFQIVYLEMTDFRSATDDPASLVGGGVTYHHEADNTVQKAILAIIGPSATSINEYLHDDARNSLENVDYRLDFEHYPSDTVDAGTGEAAREGRHKDIRPDTINLWEEITGETVTVRGASGETDTVKATVRDSSDVVKFSVEADGTVTVRYSASAQSALTRLRVAATSAEVFIQTQENTHEAALTFNAGAGTGGNPFTSRLYAVRQDGVSFDYDDDGSGSSKNIFFVDLTGKVKLFETIIAGDGLRAVDDGQLTLSGGLDDAGTGGNSALLKGSNADATGTDLDGGDATVSGGDSEGTGHSSVSLKAATPGSSGSVTNTAENYLVCDGATGKVVISKGTTVVSAVDVVPGLYSKGLGASDYPGAGGVAGGNEELGAGLIGIGASQAFATCGVVGQGGTSSSSNNAGVFGLAGSFNGNRGVWGDGFSITGLNGVGIRGDGKGATIGAGGEFYNTTGLGLRASGATGGSPARGSALMVAQQAAPSGSVEQGEWWVHDDGGKPQIYNGTHWDRPVVQSYANTGVQSRNSGEGTTTDLYFTDLEYTIPADTLKVGSTIRTRSFFLVDWNNTSQDTRLSLWYGSNEIIRHSWADVPDELTGILVMIETYHIMLSGTSLYSFSYALYTATTADADKTAHWTRLYDSTITVAPGTDQKLRWSTYFTSAAPGTDSSQLKGYMVDVL